jgi:hypothetical protein
MHVPDKAIDALRARERKAPSTCQTKARTETPGSATGCGISSGPFAGHSGPCTQVSRQQVGVFLLMFKAQRQVRLRRDAVELV